VAPRHKALLQRNRPGITQALLERGWLSATSRRSSSPKELTPRLISFSWWKVSRGTAVEVVDAALTHFGRFDLLVNNAGILFRSFSPTTAKRLQSVMIPTRQASSYMSQQVDAADDEANSGMW